MRPFRPLPSTISAESRVCERKGAAKPNCADAWRKALEGFDVIESTIVNEWKAEARREGFEKGELKGERRAKAETLLRLIQKRHGGMPEDLGNAIRGCEDTAKLDAWIDATVTASSLDDFRRLAGL